MKKNIAKTRLENSIKPWKQEILLHIKDRHKAGLLHILLHLIFYDMNGFNDHSFAGTVDLKIISSRSQELRQQNSFGTL